MKAHSAAAWTAAFFLASVLFAHTVALRLLLLAMGLVLVVATILRERERIQLLPPIWIPFLLWAGWAALSISWSLEPERSAKEFRNEVIYAGAAFWMCFVGAQARDAIRVIPSVLAVAVVGVTGVGICYFIFLPEAYPHGVHGGAGNLSSAVITLFPCVAAGGWYAGRNRAPQMATLAVLVALLLLLGAAYTTLNRTVWLAIAVQLLVAAFLLWRRDELATLHTRRARITAAAVALLVVTGSVAMAVQVHVERQAIGAPVMEKDPRLSLWPEALERIEERPLTGYGFGRGLLREDLRETFGNPLLWHTHNLFLDTVLQTGLPGLALLLLLVAAALREGWRLARDENPDAAACGFALVALVVGMLVRNMTDVLWVRQNALLFWGTTGVLLAWGPRLRAAAAR